MDARNYDSLEEFEYCRRLFKKRFRQIIALNALPQSMPIPLGIFVLPELFALYMFTLLVLMSLIHFLDFDYGPLSDHSLQKSYKSKQAYIDLLDKAIGD